MFVDTFNSGTCTNSYLKKQLKLTYLNSSMVFFNTFGFEVLWWIYYFSILHQHFQKNKLSIWIKRKKKCEWLYRLLVLFSIFTLFCCPLLVIALVIALVRILTNTMVVIFSCIKNWRWKSEGVPEVMVAKCKGIKIFTDR